MEGDFEDSLLYEDEEDPVDMEIVREGMKLVPIPDVPFQDTLLSSVDDHPKFQAIIKHNAGGKGTEYLKRKNDGSLLDTVKRMKMNDGVKGSHHFVVDEGKGNEAVLPNIWGESAELVPTGGTVSETCPIPNSSLWTAEDDLLLKNAVEAGAALEALAKGAVRFSRRFTFRELRERWHALLYNPEIAAQAAARMVEVELSLTGLPKPTRSGKLKGKEETVRKQRLDSVRAHYYQMRKRIDAETILSLDENCILTNDSVAGFTGSANEGLDIEDRTFCQMVSFLAAGGVEGVVSAFPPAGMGSFKINSVAETIMPDGHNGISRLDPSVMLDPSAVGGVNELISTERLHDFPEDMVHVVADNAVTIQDSSYMLQMDLPSDLIRTTLTGHNESGVNTMLMVDHNPGTSRSMDTSYVRTRGFEQEGLEDNSCTLGVCSPPNRTSWEAGAVLLTPTMSVDVNNNAKKSTIGIEDSLPACSDGPKKLQKHGCLGLRPLATKEDLSIPSGGLNQFSVAKTQHGPLRQSATVFLADNSEGHQFYASRDGNDMVDKIECPNTGYDILVTPLKVEPQVDPLECVGIKSVSSSNDSVLDRSVCEKSKDLCMVATCVQASQEGNPAACETQVSTLVSFCDNHQPLPFVHGPMNCALNTEDTDVPCNDEFVPLAFQVPTPMSAVVQSSYPEQTVAGGSLSTKGVPGNQRHFESGLHVIKEESETLETLVEGANGLQPLGFSREEESNKPYTGYRQVKREVFEYTTPPAACQTAIASKEDRKPGISSTTVSTMVAPNVAQEVVSMMPLTIENSFCNKFEFVSPHNPIEDPIHSNSCSVEFAQPSQLEVTLPPGVQDNMIQVSQVECLGPVEAGFSQEISSEEAAINQSPRNQEDQLSDSAEELPHFSDVEAAILEMDLDPGDDEFFSPRTESKHLYQHHKKAIMRLEQTANSAMQRSLSLKGAVAILYGRHLKYFIRKNEVSMGRVTQDNIVDIDLGKEGHANKVSRRQATIKLKEDGIFYLKNLGRRAIAVNDNEITSGQRISLGSNCLIEVGGMRFIFEMNKKLVKQQMEQMLQARYHG